MRQQAINQANMCVHPAMQSQQVSGAGQNSYQYSAQANWPSGTPTMPRPPAVLQAGNQPAEMDPTPMYYYSEAAITHQTQQENAPPSAEACLTAGQTPMPLESDQAAYRQYYMPQSQIPPSAQQAPPGIPHSQRTPQGNAPMSTSHAYNRFTQQPQLFQGRQLQSYNAVDQVAHTPLRGNLPAGHAQLNNVSALPSIGTGYSPSYDQLPHQTTQARLLGGNHQHRKFAAEEFVSADTPQEMSDKARGKQPVRPIQRRPPNNNTPGAQRPRPRASVGTPENRPRATNANIRHHAIGSTKGASSSREAEMAPLRTERLPITAQNQTHASLRPALHLPYEYNSAPGSGQHAAAQSRPQETLAVIPEQKLANDEILIALGQVFRDVSGVLGPGGERRRLGFEVIIPDGKAAETCMNEVLRVLQWLQKYYVLNGNHGRIPPDLNDPAMWVPPSAVVASAPAAQLTHSMPPGAVQTDTMPAFAASSQTVAHTKEPSNKRKKRKIAPTRAPTPATHALTAGAQGLPDNSGNQKSRRVSDGCKRFESAEEMMDAAARIADASKAPGMATQGFPPANAQQAPKRKRGPDADGGEAMKRAKPDHHLQTQGPSSAQAQQAQQAAATSAPPELPENVRQRIKDVQAVDRAVPIAMVLQFMVPTKDSIYSAVRQAVGNGDTSDQSHLLFNKHVRETAFAEYDQDYRRKVEARSRERSEWQEAAAHEADINAQRITMAQKEQERIRLQGEKAAKEAAREEAEVAAKEAAQEEERLNLLRSANTAPLPDASCADSELFSAPDQIPATTSVDDGTTSVADGLPTTMFSDCGHLTAVDLSGDNQSYDDLLSWTSDNFWIAADDDPFDSNTADTEAALDLDSTVLPDWLRGEEVPGHEGSEGA